MKVREPVARPLDVVAVELLLSASQAFLAGVLMYLAIGLWDDRGVGTGPVAIILALFGLAIGGSWLYWLLGGVGWPLAAANTPVAMFLGFALVLGWFGEDFLQLPGVPLLPAVAAAVYGIICGVFLDSPRRWRWDQRQKLRPGTAVPRVSPTTQALAAAVPRTLPRRSRASVTTSELAARIGQAGRTAQQAGGDAGLPKADDTGPAAGGRSPELPPYRSEADDTHQRPADDVADLAEAPAVAGTPLGSGRTRLVTASVMSPGQPVGVASTVVEAGTGDSGAIVLPTSVEPRAQRSPWAWAAPPEWNRDEDDEVASSGPSKRT
ncbi:MAG TPA: hypothetical protein VK987_04405 [Anaerolineae bacterium]|nr:hypothetical protein [Anaerolineae bacterium]